MRIVTARLTSIFSKNALRKTAFATTALTAAVLAGLGEREVLKTLNSSMQASLCDHGVNDHNLSGICANSAKPFSKPTAP